MITIAVDFDGTIVEHDYPRIGEEAPFAISVLKELIDNGIKIILYTMRSGDTLKEAVDWLTERGIELYGINENPTQKTWTDSPKPYADIYIDDAALGCPLTKSPNFRWVVDWEKVRKELSVVL